MTKRSPHAVPQTVAQDRASAWAVALLVASSGFALLAVVLLSTGYGLA